MTVKEHLFLYLSKKDYARAYEYSNKTTLSEECEDCSEALQIAFRWDKTKEGHEYWQHIYENVCRLLDSEDKEIKAKLIKMPGKLYKDIRNFAKKKGVTQQKVIVTAINKYINEQ